MGKHDSFSSHSKQRRKEVKIHPIWRGVGFIFIIMIPILSYVAAGEIINQNNLYHWFVIPSDILARKGDLLFMLGGSLINVKLMITFSIAFVLFALFMLITFLINSLFGSSRYGTYDLPPLELPKGVRKSKAR